RGRGGEGCCCASLPRHPLGFHCHDPDVDLPPTLRPLVRSRGVGGPAVGHHGRRPSPPHAPPCPAARPRRLRPLRPRTRVSLRRHSRPHSAPPPHAVPSPRPGPT